MKAINKLPHPLVVSDNRFATRSPHNFDMKNRPNPPALLHLLLLEVLYGGETSKNQNFRKEELRREGANNTYKACDRWSAWEIQEEGNTPAKKNLNSND